jgi:hypothetical protein
MASKLFQQEAVMGQVIPKQHPAVVLRSHYKLVKSLLAVALAAVVALSAAVVILANDDDQLSGGTTSAPQAESINYGGFNPATGKPETVQQQNLPAGTRFDGGPDEGTRGIQAQPVAPGTRFDGGPDEGTRGPQSYWETSNPRTSYQPTPNEGFKARAGGPPIIPMGPSH